MQTTADDNSGAGAGVVRGQRCGARAVLRANLWVKAGLVNGSQPEGALLGRNRQRPPCIKNYQELKLIAVTFISIPPTAHLDLAERLACNEIYYCLEVHFLLSVVSILNHEIYC